MSRHTLTRSDRLLPTVVQLRDGTCVYVPVQPLGAALVGVDLDSRQRRGEFDETGGPY